MENRFSSLFRPLRALAAGGAPRHLGIVLGATNIANVLVWGFSVAVARFLGPSEYGTFIALMALYLLLSPVIDSIEAIITRSSTLAATSAGRGLKALLTGGLSRSALLGGVVFVVVAAASPLIADFIKAPVGAVVIVGLCAAPAALTATSNGMLRGLSRFERFAAAVMTNGAGRLILGLLAVSLGFGLTGALAGVLLALALALVVSFFGVRDIFLSTSSLHAEKVRWSYRLSGHTLLGMAALAALIHLPMALVVHFFDPLSAGYFASVATVGKMVFFLPAGVALVFLPTAARKLAEGQGVLRALRKSQLIVVGIAGGFTLLLLLFSQFTILIGFGEQYLPALSLLPAVSLAAVGYALASVWLSFYIALGDGVFSRLLAVAAIGQLAVIWLWHPGMIEVVAFLACVSLVVLLAGELYLRLLTRKGKLGLRQPATTVGAIGR